jgi:hypothetical protein
MFLGSAAVLKIGQRLDREDLDHHQAEISSSQRTPLHVQDYQDHTQTLF